MNAPEQSRRACLTVRARVEAVRLVRRNRSVASVAATFSAWATVMRAVCDDATQVLEAPDGERVVAFGLDEMVMDPSRSHTRRRHGCSEVAVGIRDSVT